VIAILDQCADGVSQTAEGQIDLFGLLQTFALDFAFEDLLTACEVDQIEFAFNVFALSVYLLEIEGEDDV
jgi:hypothetical protein